MENAAKSANPLCLHIADCYRVESKWNEREKRCLPIHLASVTLSFILVVTVYETGKFDSETVGIVNLLNFCHPP